LVAAAKFLVAGTKKIFVVPNFVTVTKPFFSVHNFENAVKIKADTTEINVEHQK